MHNNIFSKQMGRNVLSISVTLSFFVLAGAAGLNDTGQTHCYDTWDARTDCRYLILFDDDILTRQDARYGRDAQAMAGRLTKVGTGTAGFDFTKVSNLGASLPATATLGSGPNDWACTRDNVTGLVWEVKSNAGLRSRNHLYTWYSTNGTSNGGQPGATGDDSCDGTLGAYANECNTQNYVTEVNRVGMCGTSNWRLPSHRELFGIQVLGAIDGTNHNLDRTYFPESTDFITWSATTYMTDVSEALSTNGNSHAKTVRLGVRLVRN